MTTNEMLSAAQWYASQGYQVAPVEINLHGRGEKTKKQIISRTSWGEAATSNPDQVAAWFSDAEMEKHPHQGILIATGERSNLLVLDADNLSYMDDLMEQYGKLPETFTVKSQSGSLHYYFTFPTGRISQGLTNWGTTAGLVDPGFDSHTGRQGVGIDLRGNGGAIFAPPTKTYQNGRQVGAYTVHSTAPVAECPQWIIDLYESRAKKKTQGDRPRPKVENWESETGELTDAHERTTKFILAQAEEQFQGIMDAGWGAQWDNEVTRVMGILVRLVNSPWSEFEESDLDTFLVSYAPEDDNFGAPQWERIKNSCFRMADGEILEPFEDEEIDPAMMQWAMDHAKKKDEERAESEDKRTDLEGPLATIPDEFWNARPLYQGIRAHAYHRIESADSTLHSFLAAYTARIPHQYELETGVGTPAKPLFFSIIAAESGEGKGSATSLGYKLAKNELNPVPMGSGEGLIESFLELQVDEDDESNYRMKDGEKVLINNPKKKKVQVNHNLLVSESEGSSFVSLMDRPQSQLATTILKLAVGEELGQTNAYAESSRFVPARSYSAGAVIGVQYEGAGHILARHGVGLSQRFFWATAIDPNAYDIPETPPELQFHEPLPVNQWKGYEQPVRVYIDDTIIAPMRQARLDVRTGKVKVDPYDSHRVGLVLRLALTLRMLDGPNMGYTDQTTGQWVMSAYQVTVEDWDLANMLYETSKKVRTQLLKRAQVVMEQKQREAGKADAVRRVAASDTEGDLRMKTTKEKALAALEKLDGNEKYNPTMGNVKAFTTKSYQPMVEAALLELVSEGKVTYDEGTKYYALVKEES